MVDNARSRDAERSAQHGQLPIWHLPCGSRAAWYVAETHPGADAEAIEHLSRQAFQTFQPCVLERRTVRRKTSIEPVPMFPGYVFVALDLSAHGWRSAFHTRGIKRFLCHAPERPSRVPDEVILLVAVNAAKLDKATRDAMNQPIEPGKPVRVKLGPWAGFDGVCLWSRNDRIAVMLTMLGRTTEVEMPLSRVEARA
jgi:transcriptional antiterminator RfaH